MLELYGNRVRLRVCGICVFDDRILLVGHRLPGHNETFWSPPGGGIQFGETSRSALKREFLEETGLQIKVGQILFLNEFIEPPLHAIELFFRIDSFEGTLMAGNDPEFSEASQIIQQVRFMSMTEIQKIPQGSRHRVFKHIQNLNELFDLTGYLNDSGF